MNKENNSIDTNSDIFLKDINLEDTIEFDLDNFNDKINLKDIELEDTLNLGGNEYGE